MHHADLSPIWLSANEGPPKLLAVGWLEPGHDYRRGGVELEVVRKLADLLVNPWQPGLTMGRHSCGFCRLTGGPASFHLDGRINDSAPRMGVSNLWLPADGFLFVAPSLILHYMDSHEYSPPDEFKEAVMACPPMRSMTYLKALLKHGPREIFPAIGELKKASS
jgi:hypothetical protein